MNEQNPRETFQADQADAATEAASWLDTQQRIQIDAAQAHIRMEEAVASRHEAMALLWRNLAALVWIVAIAAVATAGWMATGAVIGAFQ